MNELAVQLLNDLHVEVLSSEADFDALKDDWDELLNESNQCVYFLRWSWNRLWWRAYASSNSRLYLIACRDQSGQLVGLAPLYWRRISAAGIARLREVLFLGTGIPISTSEQLDLIARRGYERPLAEAIAAFVLKDGDVDRLWLSDVPITSAVLPHFRRAIGQRQSVRLCKRAHYVDTRTFWDAFRRSLGKSTRAKIERCTRRLFRSYNCEFRCVEAREDLEPAMDAFVRLHQARWQSKGQPGSFALRSFEEFLRGAMRSTFSEGRLRLWTLAVDGQTAAILLAFFDNGVAHYFQGGFDPKYAKDSLGTVMFGLCIRACIDANDISEFNFMGGDASYKEHWTKLGMDSVDLEWLRPGVRSQLFRISGQGERVGRSFLRLVTPEAIKEKIKAVRRRRNHHTQKLRVSAEPKGHTPAGAQPQIQTSQGKEANSSGRQENRLRERD